MVLAACGVSGLAFVKDDRVEIISPEDRSEVELPVTVRWRAPDVSVGEGQGEFAVLVDRSPPPPGKPLAWLFRDDDACERSPGCPDEEYLAQRRVFTTTDTSMVVGQVLVDDDRPDAFHEITIVLLDERGRRSGEAAWYVQIRPSDRG